MGAAGANKARMRLDVLRRLALSLPSTRASEQWGGLAFKVEEKVFLFVAVDGSIAESVVFKCAPTEFDALTEIDGIEQAPYFAKRHWVRLVDPSALKATDLERRIKESYELVVANLPKKVQAALRSAGASPRGRTRPA